MELLSLSLYRSIETFDHKTLLDCYRSLIHTHRKHYQLLSPSLSFGAVGYGLEDTDVDVVVAARHDRTQPPFDLTTLASPTESKLTSPRTFLSRSGGQQQQQQQQHGTSGSSYEQERQSSSSAAAAAASCSLLTRLLSNLPPPPLVPVPRRHPLRVLPPLPLPRLRSSSRLPVQQSLCDRTPSRARSGRSLDAHCLQTFARARGCGQRQR